MKLLSPEQRRPEGVPSQPARIIERVEVDHCSFALDRPEPSLQVVPQELTEPPSPASEEAIVDRVDHAAVDVAATEIWLLAERGHARW